MAPGPVFRPATKLADELKYRSGNALASVDTTVSNDTMSRSLKSEITKVEAAQRQLDCAIRLYFTADDILAAHTLAHAAFRILFDVYPKQRGDGFASKLDQLIAELGWRDFNRIPNFLKHADTDFGQVLADHSPHSVEMTIGFAAVLHHRLLGHMTPEMRAFDTWVHVLNPEIFELPSDSDPDFDRQFRKSVDDVKRQPRHVQFALGLGLLEFYGKNPNVGGFGAPRDRNE